MDTLRAARHLLAADEDIVRVGVALVGRVGHRVERTEPHGELVDDVEVLRDVPEIWPRYGRDVAELSANWVAGRTWPYISLMISYHARSRR